MKLSKSAAGILSARYRSVLIKCFLANLAFFSLPSKAETISDGTHDGTSKSYSGALLIEGGTFSNVDFSAPEITIVGGTLSDILRFETFGTFSISSDNAVFAPTWNKDSKNYSEIEAATLKITGNKGISVSDTAINASSVSGNITAGGNSLLGDFVNTEDYVFQSGGKTLHSASSKTSLSENKHDVEFSNSTITLNGNASAGSGYYSLSSDLFTPINHNPASVSTEGGAVSPLLLFRDQLTETEINDAVTALLDDVYGSSAELSDFSKIVFGGTTKKDIQSSFDRTTLEGNLRQLYNQFNDNFKDYGADVTVSNSTIVLNDNAKLINDSMSSKKQSQIHIESLNSSFEAGNIDVTQSTIIANGNNELSAKSGRVAFFESTLKVSDNAVLSFSSADGALYLDGASTLDLTGKMTGNVAADGATIAFQSSSARLDGKLSGTADVNFNDDYALSNLTLADNFSFRNIVIGNGKTLDIGTSRLTASSISGGTIAAILTDAAKTTPIITTTAQNNVNANVTVKLEMSAASNTQTTLYHITSEKSGFTLGNYLTKRYAVSTTYFDKANAAKIGVLTNWNGGDLYILRLGDSASSITDDLKNSGIKVNPVVEDALQILDLDSEDLDKLTDKQQNALNKVDDLLAKFDGDAQKQYQIMREIAPDLSRFGLLIDETTAKNVINVVSTRFNMPAQPFHRYYRRMYGRSGGDYESGNGAVWAQGLYNHAEQSGTESFSSNSAGFAAGVEGYVSDDFKAGVGYSYASTSIDADRSDVDVDTHTGFVYAQYQPKRFYTNFFAGFGRSSYNDTTKIAKLESEYETNTASAQIAVGYASSALLSPEIAFRFINTHQKAYTDALGVELKAKNSSTATAVGGFKLSKRYRIKTQNSVSFIPELKAAATYDFARTNGDRTALLPNGASYIVKTEKDKRFGVEAGAGFSFGFGKSGSLSVLYDGMFQGKLKSHSAVLNVKINL